MVFTKGQNGAAWFVKRARTVLGCPLHLGEGFYRVCLNQEQNSFTHQQVSKGKVTEEMKVAVRIYHLIIYLFRGIGCSLVTFM
jgi:hypothetical protein